MKKRTMLVTAPAFAIAAAVVAACSSSSTDSPSTGSADASPDASAEASSSSDAVATTPCTEANEGPTAPADATALQAWLGTRVYACWKHESVRHPSTGPHAGNVQVYVNAKLDASLKAGGEHAMGSVAVKELYANGGTEVTGWAVSVKTQASSAAGQGYYWFETFGTTAGASHSEGQGEALCVNCHSGGQDFVLIPYPLR